MTEEIKSFLAISDKLEFKALEGNYCFEGYLSTPDWDRVKDKVTDSCLDDLVGQISNSSILGSYEHEWKKTGIRKPISKITEAKRDDRGVFVKGIFNKATDNFEKIWYEVQNGFLPFLSIEYSVKDSQQVPNGGRILNKLELLGYGHTSIPANPNCTLTNCFVKSLESINEEVKKMTEEKAEPVKEELKVETPKIEVVKKEDVLETQKIISEKESKIKELESKVSVFEKEKADKTLEQKVEEIAKKKIEEAMPKEKVIQAQSEQFKEENTTIRPFKFSEWNRGLIKR